MTRTHKASLTLPYRVQTHPAIAFGSGAPHGAAHGFAEEGGSPRIWAGRCTG
jgi:hypothetical protein